MADANPQRPDGVAAAFAPATVDSSATPVVRLEGVSQATTGEPSYALFFYGTLIHPAILAKVIGNDGRHVKAQPAVLPGYALHHVKNEDYPGLVPQSVSDEILVKHGRTKEASSTRAVRGTLVRGLRYNEVRRLDAFEGDEYRRAGVHVIVNDHVKPLSNTDRPRDASLGQFLGSLTQQRIEEMLTASEGQDKSGTEQGHSSARTFANVYLWDASPLDTLDPGIWSFETFTASGKDRRWWT